MARRRFQIDADSGLLVDRDGNALGRVISLTVDDAPVGGRGVGRRGASGSNVNSEQDEAAVRGGLEGGSERRPTASQLEREAVQRIWAYYLEVIPSRRRLDHKRERIIRYALKLVGEEAVKRAILGLSRSPHHNGINEQNKTYLEIRYALKGIGDESDDERIEKAITWAALHAPSTQQVDPDKVARWLDDLRFYVEKLSTHSGAETPVTGRERANEAYKKLRRAGFNVVRLDKAPWARVTR